MIEYFDNGVIDFLVKKKMVKKSVLYYPSVFKTFTKHTSLGLTKTQSIKKTSIECMICERQVWEIISLMQ
jgi:hypothetical protein